ncbi:MAG: hypothetical protein KKA42_09160 [candidate division Zixibacteria bacterium]|nr:hypothetical protein [candidate division Zixibacteria bacterium]
MKKFVIAAMGLMLLMSGAVFATDTRTAVMGDNDLIVVDDANVFRFPGRTLNYPNLATAEFSDNSSIEFYKFGVNWQFNDDNPWVLGTYFTNNFYGMVPSLYVGGSLDFDPADWLLDNRENQRIDLLYGRSLFGNNFGFRFNYFRSSYSNEVTDNDAKQSFGYYQFGFGLTEALTGQWDVALNLGLGSFCWEDDTGGTVVEPDGYYDMDLEGRYFWVRSPKVTLVPHAGFGIGKRGATAPSEDDPAETDKVSQTRFGFDGGIGLNYVTGPDLLAVMDFGVMYRKYSTDYDEYDIVGDTMILSESELSTVTIPYFKLGFEGQVFKWMDVRFGATSYWNIETEKDIEKFKDVENDTYLGFGFHWGRLHVDTETDPELFLNGFDFISGYGDGDMNFRISALYEMF